MIAGAQEGARVQKLDPKQLQRSDAEAIFIDFFIVSIKITEIDPSRIELSYDLCLIKASSMGFRPCATMAGPTKRGNLQASATIHEIT